MEERDRKLLEKLAETDSEIKGLWEDHVLYGKQLDKLESKPFLTPAEEVEMKSLKKQKLEGKTRLVSLLQRHKQQEA